MAHDSSTRPDPARAAQSTTRIDSAEIRAASLVGGRYELGELIGEGGAARVYHARDKVLDRVVALKLLRDEYGADEEFIARFYREARAVASLSNPHIVDIYDYGAHEKTYFIAMQYIEGTDLKSILRSKGRLDPARVVALSDDILRGLGAAHERGIVHRDVKPQNLLVRASDGHVKLTDFGVARTLDASQHTAAGTTVGTAHYMAPEQASGGILSPASDLYAVGVVLFEALTGRLPYDGTTSLQIALQHMRDPIPAVTAIAPEVPPALARVVERALSKDPAARYPNAEAMRLALHEALSTAAPLSKHANVAPTAVNGQQTRVLPPIGGANNAAAGNRGNAAHAARPATRGSGSGCVLPILGLLIVALLVAVVVLARTFTSPSRATATIAAGTGQNPTTAAVLVPGTSTIAPPTPTTAIPTSTLAPPTATAVPPTPVAPIVVPPTATPAPPTATIVPPTATALPPTATATIAPPPPTATVAPPPPTPTSTTRNPGQGNNGNVQVDKFKPEQLQGAYRRDDGKLYGLPEVALYGEGTNYSQGTLNFRASNVPDGTIIMTIVGLDDERNDHCRLQVILNGTTVFDAPNTFPNAPTNDNGVGGKERYWNDMAIRIPSGVLREGANTLILRNRTPGPNVGIPYMLISDITFDRER